MGEPEASVRATLSGTLTRIDGGKVQFDADPGAPRHQRRMFIARWPGDSDLVGQRIRIAYHATPSYGAWGFIGPAFPRTTEVNGGERHG